MLGELLGGSEGRITEVRSPSGREPGRGVEVAFRGAGRLLEHDVAEVGTFAQTSMQGGVVHVEWRVVQMTADGHVLVWRGFGVGSTEGMVTAVRQLVCGTYQVESGALARLDGALSVVRFEADANGAYRYSMWQSY